MTLEDFMEQLAFGELAGTSLIDKETGLIAAEKQPKVISFINRGLTKLHTQFLLKEDLVTIVHTADTELYKLDSRNSVQNGGAVQYILDTVVKPFTDNALMIEFLYDEEGTEICINNNDEGASTYFTPGNRLIQITVLEVGTIFHVAYRANHDRIALDTVDLSLVDIDLADNFLDALGYFVASKAYASIGSPDSRKTSVSLHAQYNDEVFMLKSNSQGALDFNTTPISNRPNGWV